MPKMEKDDNLLNPKIWRYLVNFWTFIIYITIFADFFAKNSAREFLGPISAIYIALLAIYTAGKEFERWHDYNVGRHPGEMYVYIWTLIVVLLLVLELYTHGSYKLPSEVFNTYIVVIGILAITRKSKSNYLVRRRK